MSEQAEPKKICPYLGLATDRASSFSYPESTHICFATGQAASISLEHQSAFCLTERYSTCLRFVEPPPELQPARIPLSRMSESEVPPEADEEGFLLGRTILWAVAGVLAGLLIIFGLFYYGDFALQQIPITGLAEQTLPSPTASLTAIPTPTEIAAGTPTPVLVSVPPTPTPTATPESDDQIYTISPAAADIGWVSSGEDRGNNFGDSFLYTGIFEDQIYNGAFQFDLSSIPRGAPIYSASIQLTGLRDDRLAVHLDQSDAAGTWSLRLLDSEIDQDWRRHNYQDIFNAPVLQTLLPILSSQNLAVGQPNLFELSVDQIKILETRIIENENPTVSFRTDGPLFGPDNLFAWDTGYGPQSGNNKITLLLNVGPPPATPPLYKYVVVTSTPTPENVVTAAAVMLQMTADATSIGTATPIPPNMVTATPIPDYLIIVPTPIPENTATAQALAALATAEALTTGTPPPPPTNAVTATPIPTATVTPTPLPTPIPNYILITSTPTPKTIFAAATLSAEGTIQAQQVGTPTPLPPNWVTPFVVTASPTPINSATAQALAEVATAIAFTTGTPTPTPSNMVTATPTPVFEVVSLLLTPTPVIPTPTPQAIPSLLLGKILFQSDREGEATGYIYVFDPDTGELGRLTDDWPYQVARERDAYSADTVYRAYVKQLLWTNTEDSSGNRRSTTVFAIHAYDYKFKLESIVAWMGAGDTWDPVWSPTSEQIAFVSNDSGDDEIWVIDRDGSNQRRLTNTNEGYNAREIGKDSFFPEVNGHPSWSPDGSRLVFWSNRTENRQLWIMNADGSEQRLLMGWDNWTPYNDWAPVWIKYLDPAPPENKKR